MSPWCRAVWWFKWKMSLIDSGTGISGPLLVSLLREVMNPLRGGALLEYVCVCLWGQALEMYSLPQHAIHPLCFICGLKTWTPNFLLQHLVAMPPRPQWTVPSSGTINQYKLFPSEVPLDYGIFITWAKRNWYRLWPYELKHPLSLLSCFSQVFYHRNGNKMLTK